MILAISRRPRRISLEGVVVTRPSASGATIAGQKKRRKMNAPTAVNLASGNLVMTAVEIYGARVRQGYSLSRHGRLRLTILQIFLKDIGI